MDGADFSRLRTITHRSQKDLAAMLGVSQKAVESYEQGWRRVPVTVERMMYYIAFKLNGSRLVDEPPCWKARHCPEATKADCAAWVSNDGHFCWFITGRLCAASKNAGGSNEYCYECPVFVSLLDTLRDDAKEAPCP